MKASAKNGNIVKLSQRQFPTVQTPFFYYELRPAGAVIKSVYKSYKINCSIFEDALDVYLNRSMVVESWGRPLEPAWCANKSGKYYEVRNVVKVQVGSLSWSEQDDHSKWIVAPGYACFGDMNRMTSQWHRGGSFFCIQSDSVYKALNAAVVQVDNCS